MHTSIISLCYVRMAIKKPAYPRMWSAAMSTHYAPAMDWDGRMLHGACITFDGDLNHA